MNSRTRSRKPASIGSNHSSRRPTAISASEPRTGNFVLLLVMAWSPPAHNAGIVWVSAPGDYATFNSNHTPDGTSLKYEEVYLNAYESVAEAKAGIGAWLSFYNDERQHQSLGYRTPRQIYQEGLWICGRSASPTGCASPASRASSEGGEMLAFAHIPTGATANEGFNIDEVNNRFAEPAVALTAIGADIETGRVTP